MNWEPIEVNCYSGYKGEEAPRKFIFQDNEFVIKEILEYWYERSFEPQTPVEENFKVKTETKETYRIKHNHNSNTWYLLSKA